MQACVLRADASEHVGTGHLMRLLALADAARQLGVACTFVLAAPEELCALARERGHAVQRVDVPTGSAEDAGQLTRVVRAQRAGLCVVDGYAFGEPFFRALEPALGDSVLLTVVDLAGQCAGGQVVLNQNYLAAVPRLLRADARILRGPEFALLRAEFRRTARPDRTSPPEATRLRLLLSFGGSDPTHASLRLARLLCDLEVDVDVVLGAGYRGPPIPSCTMGPARLKVRRAVKDMATLMARADLAMVAAGSILYELAYMRVPTLAFSVAENQTATAEALGTAGLIRYGGTLDAQEDARVLESVRALLESPAERSSLGRALGGLVDGMGAERVLSFARSLRS